MNKTTSCVLDSWSKRDCVSLHNGAVINLKDDNISYTCKSVRLMSSGFIATRASLGLDILESFLQKFLKDLGVRQQGTTSLSISVRSDNTNLKFGILSVATG